MLDIFLKKGICPFSPWSHTYVLIYIKQACKHYNFTIRSLDNLIFCRFFPLKYAHWYSFYFNIFHLYKQQNFLITQALPQLSYIATRRTHKLFFTHFLREATHTYFITNKLLAHQAWTILFWIWWSQKLQQTINMALVVEL